MPEARPLQVFSNAPDELTLKIDKQDYRFSDLENPDLETSALFLFTPRGRAGEDFDLIINNWLKDTNKMIETYLSFNGMAIMFFVPMVQKITKEVLLMMNDALFQEAPLDSIELTFENDNPLWILAYEAELRSDISSFVVMEEALAMCTFIEDQEVDERRVAEDLSLSALRYLLSVDVTKKKVEVLTQEKETLVLQLLQVQEELEHFYLEFKAIRDKPKNETVLQRVKLLYPLPKESIDEYRQILFDSDYYCQQAGHKFMPFVDYKFWGWKKGLDPHLLFDSRYYLEQIEHSLESLTMSPLMHYIEYGARLNLSPHPEFDAIWYLEENPDVAENGMPSLIHFAAYGWQEGRKPNPAFDCDWYVNRYEDVSSSGMNPLKHYILYGKEEGRGRNAFDL